MLLIYAGIGVIAGIGYLIAHRGGTRSGPLAGGTTIPALFILSFGAVALWPVLAAHWVLRPRRGAAS